MNVKGFRAAGHWPTLLSVLLYFDISFAVWVLLGPLCSFIAEDLRLTATEKGLLVATPLLGGSIFRVVMGWLTDHLGPRRAGLWGICVSFVPLLLGWRFADSLATMFLVALLLGVPGASFAVALPLVSRWYPPRYQGVAMGIAGAGNSGTVLAAVFMPRLAEAVGWQGAMALAAIPMAIAGGVFFLCAKDSPNRSAPTRAGGYAAVLTDIDTAWFCLFYGITFGGFVGLSSFLGIFFRDQYGLSKVTAGDLTALSVLAGSFMRPVGGMLADRLGGIRVLIYIYAIVALLLLAIARLPSIGFTTVLFFTALAVLGAGNGSVFQLVPQRFQNDLGVITGLVGAAGGIGGFFLPSGLGVLRDITGTYASGFLAYALVCLWGMTLVLAVKRGWHLTWAPDSGKVSPSEGGRLSAQVRA